MSNDEKTKLIWSCCLTLTDPPRCLDQTDCLWSLSTRTAWCAGMSNTDNTDSQPWTSKMTLRLLTNVYNTYIIYIYNNRSRGHRWWSWLYYVWIWEESHVDYTPIEFNISTRKMNLRSMRRWTLYRWCKRRMLLNMLLSIWSIPTTVITWAVLLSHLEQMFDGRSKFWQG